MYWIAIDSQILPKDFKPNNQKDNKAILNIYTVIKDNEIIKKYTRIVGDPEPPYDMPIALVSYIMKDENVDRIKLDVDFHNFYPDKLYKVEIDNYARKYGFVYRPSENAVIQFEGV